MIGFIAAVAPEILNPNHPTVGKQLYTLATFLPNLFLK